MGNSFAEHCERMDEELKREQEEHRTARCWLSDLTVGLGDVFAGYAER